MHTFTDTSKVGDIRTRIIFGSLLCFKLIQCSYHLIKKWNPWERNKEDVTIFKQPYHPCQRKWDSLYTFRLINPYLKQYSPCEGSTHCVDFNNATLIYVLFIKYSSVFLATAFACRVHYCAALLHPDPLSVCISSRQCMIASHDLYQTSGGPRLAGREHVFVTV